MTEKTLIRRVRIPLSAILHRLIFYRHCYDNTPEELLKRVKRVGWPTRLSLKDIETSLVVLSADGQVKKVIVDGRDYYYSDEEPRRLTVG
ncbi:MAG: hypothetical protein HYW89_03690 [Candidatus Sungiibacteriota bacterium]|uniref:Uncharacterized protein n=1 Tax=Candidatus Sungiibacteriota bacterium TaxID=2750080 RepID=A0A7T5UQD8_9BACT|nr:MAG: hypothetical protein HYW89_03690 [Candidatus Sungbacteria bacterium]